MQKFKKIIGVALIWFLVWAFFIVVLQEQGVDYSNHYLITSVYFMLVISSLSSIFRKEIGAYVERFTPKDLLIVSVFSAAMALIYFLVNQFIVIPSGVDVSHLPFTLRMNESFLVTKAFEIMFQQTVFIIGIYYIFDNDVSRWVDMLLFGLFALLIHIPVLLVPDSIGKILLSVSFFAGVIFSYCITKFKKGFIYSFMIHYCFYVLLGALYWLGLFNFTNYLF